MGLLDDFSGSVNGGLMDPSQAGLFGLAQGLLASSGASRLPVTLGAALANGMAGAVQGVGNAYDLRAKKTQDEMGSLNLNMLKYRLGMLGNGDPWSGGGNQPPQAPPAAPMMQAAPSVMNGQGQLRSSPLTPQVTTGVDQGTPQQMQQSQGGGMFGVDPSAAFSYGRNLALAGIPGGAEIMKAALSFAEPTTGMKDAQYSFQGDPDAARRAVRQQFTKPLTSAPGEFLRDPMDPTRIIAQNPNVKLQDLGSGFQAVDTSNMTPGSVLPKSMTPEAAASNAATLYKTRLEYGLDASQQQENASLSKAIASGQLPPPSGNAMANPRSLQVMSRVFGDNPNYDYASVNARRDAMENFTSGTLGNQMRSFATAGNHLDLLGNLVDSLGNSDRQVVNKVANFYREQTGNPAPTNFEAAKDVVSKEVMKAIVAGGGGQGEREALGEAMDNAKSPAQLKGVIKTYRDLMGAQYDNILEQRRAAGLSDSTLPNYKQASASNAAPRTVTRAGTMNGKRVVQYSDGSIDYAN